MKKIAAIIKALYRGNQVADPERWKNNTIKANLIAFIVSLIAVAATYGLSIPVTEEGIAAVASGIIAIVNVVMTMATSKKVGLDAKEKETN